MNLLDGLLLALVALCAVLLVVLLLRRPPSADEALAGWLQRLSK